MAVFTPVSESDLGPVLERFGLGGLKRLQAISEGIENTNYFVHTESGAQGEQSWVLTLFENLEADDLPYFCALTQHLASAGFDVPAPLKDANGESLFQLHGRWAVLVPRLRGAAVLRPSAADCEAVGAWLGRMHVCLDGFQLRRQLVRDRRWLEGHLLRLSDSLRKDEREDLAGYIRRYTQYESLLRSCSQGTVHGDLFRDNVLFEQGRISGVIDFYHACDATLLFDLAVVANDWTVDAAGRHQTAQLDALITAYQRERPWTEMEVKAWPYCLEVAALRFWVSRLATFYQPGYQKNTVTGVTVKDPQEMRRILHGLASARAALHES